MDIYDSYYNNKNYYYVYEYYTESAFSADMNLNVSESYISLSYIVAIILGILALGLCLFTALSTKKARPLGIIASVFQPIGLLSFVQMIVEWSKLDFGILDFRVTSSTASGAIEEYQRRATALIEEYMISHIYSYVILSFLLLASAILTVIYISRLSKLPGRGFGIGATVLLIVNQVLVQVFWWISALAAPSQGLVMFWETFYRLLLMVALVLLALQGVMLLAAKKKPAVQEAAAIQTEISANSAPLYTPPKPNTSWPPNSQN